jgi:GMP synthase (glutamine-hydrolysing)
MSSLENISASAYLIFGSTSNVCDRLPWQMQLAEMMKEQILRETPVLGICFGHQLMADAFGCTVEKNNDDIYFEGSRQMGIIQNAFGFKEGEHFEIVKSHGYEVKTITDDFIHLGKSPECFYDALALKNHPYMGVQTHPEASRDFFNEMTKKPEESDFQQSLQDGLKVIATFLKAVGTISKMP